MDWLLQILICCTAASVILSYFVHSHESLFQATPLNYSDARGEMMIINAFGKSNLKHECGRPTVRVSIGDPPVALHLGVEPEVTHGGMYVWSPKIHHSKTIAFIEKTTVGWDAIDRLHIGSFRTTRAGLGVDSYSKGFSIKLTVLDNAMGSNCDGLIGISPFSQANGLFGRFNILQMTPSFMTVMSASGNETLHNTRTNLQLEPRAPLQLQHPEIGDHSVRDEYSVLGILPEAKVVIQGETCEYKFEAEVSLFEVPKLYFGTMGSRQVGTVSVSGEAILATSCLCQDSYEGSFTVEGITVDAHDFCKYILVPNLSTDSNSISLPWTSTSAGIGYAIADTSLSHTVFVHWLPGADSKHMLIYYSIFMLFCVGTLVWYLRDKFAPCPPDLTHTPLPRQSFDHLLTEAKLIVLAMIIFFVLMTYRDDFPATTADLYTSFSFAERIVTSLCLSVSSTILAFSSVSYTLEQCAFLSLVRSYGCACVISAVVSELGRYCVTGVTRHMLALAMWAWNIRSQIEFALKVGGMKFITHHMRRVLYHDVKSSSNDKRPHRAYSMSSEIAVVLVGAVLHCAFYIVADFSDVIIGITNTAVPTYGLHAVWICVVMFLFDGSSQLVQRYSVANMVKSKLSE